MTTDSPDQNEPERLMTCIDGVDAQLLVHIERLEPDEAGTTAAGEAAEATQGNRPVSSNEGSPEDASHTGIVTDAHPRPGGESEI